MSDYNPYRVPELWTMVAPETGTAAANHLNMWERQQTVLAQQSARLKHLRDELEKKWPPTKSAAAGVFIDRITDMIQAMDQAVLASGQIRERLRNVTEALESARTAVRPLVAVYNDKAAAWREFNQRALPWLPKTLTPGGPVVPVPSPLLEQPVLRAYQQELDVKARNVLADADKTVVAASTEMAHLPNYDRFSGDGTPLLPPTSPSGNANSPIAAHIGSSGAALIPVAPLRFDPPAPLPDDGPILAGTTPIEPAVPSPGVPSGSPGSVPPPPPTDRMPWMPPIPSGGYSSRTASGQVVLHPGGVIGGPVPVQGRGNGSRSTPGVAGGVGAFAPGTRVNRVTPLTGVDRASRSGEPPGRVLGTSGWRDAQFEEYVKRRREPHKTDPDDPWAVEEGVPPVLDAPPERQHDAGPGVIGLDR